MSKNCVVITSFGEQRRPLVNRLLLSLQDCGWFSDLFVYSDYPHSGRLNWISAQSMFSGRREHHRNGDYYPIKAVSDLPFDKFCLLDDDMVIHDRSFFDAFKMLEWFDVCVPQNPRLYMGHDLHGADVSSDMWQWFYNRHLEYMPAVNFSPIFIKKTVEIEKFCYSYMREMEDNPCRGPAMLMKHMLQHELRFLILPETWCVCGENAEHYKNYKVHHTININVMALHAGHANVRKVFSVPD